MRVTETPHKPPFLLISTSFELLKSAFTVSHIICILLSCIRHCSFFYVKKVTRLTTVCIARLGAVQYKKAGNAYHRLNHIQPSFYCLYLFICNSLFYLLGLINYCPLFLWHSLSLDVFFLSVSLCLVPPLNSLNFNSIWNSISIRSESFIGREDKYLYCGRHWYRKQIEQLTN